MSYETPTLPLPPSGNSTFPSSTTLFELLHAKGTTIASTPHQLKLAEVPILTSDDLISFDPRNYIERVHNGDKPIGDDAFYQTYTRQLNKFPPLRLDRTMGPWVAGGFCTRLLDGRETTGSDFDMFFKTENQFIRIRDELIGVYNFTITKTQQNSIMMEKDGIEINLVTLEYFDTLADVFNFFDLTISQCALVTEGLGNYRMVTTPLTLRDIVSKKLVINNIHHPVATMKRILKYSNQRYELCTGGVIHFLTAVALNPELIGVMPGYVD
jgi:hypothetical protein